MLKTALAGEQASSLSLHAHLKNAKGAKKPRMAKDMRGRLAKKAIRQWRTRELNVGGAEGGKQLVKMNVGIMAAKWKGGGVAC
jgi:hypothetical protein